MPKILRFIDLIQFYKSIYIYEIDNKYFYYKMKANRMRFGQKRKQYNRQEIRIQYNRQSSILELDQSSQCSDYWRTNFLMQKRQIQLKNKALIKAQVLIKTYEKENVQLKNEIQKLSEEIITLQGIVIKQSKQIYIHRQQLQNLRQYSQNQDKQQYTTKKPSKNKYVQNLTNQKSQLNFLKDPTLNQKIKTLQKRQICSQNKLSHLTEGAVALQRKINIAERIFYENEQQHISNDLNTEDKRRQYWQFIEDSQNLLKDNSNSTQQSSKYFNRPTNKSQKYSKTLKSLKTGDDLNLQRNLMNSTMSSDKNSLTSKAKNIPANELKRMKYFQQIFISPSNLRTQGSY